MVHCPCYFFNGNILENKCVGGKKKQKEEKKEAKHKNMFSWAGWRWEISYISLSRLSCYLTTSQSFWIRARVLKKIKQLTQFESEQRSQGSGSVFNLLSSIDFKTKIKNRLSIIWNLSTFTRCTAQCHIDQPSTAIIECVLNCLENSMGGEVLLIVHLNLFLCVSTAGTDVD